MKNKNFFLSLLASMEMHENKVALSGEVEKPLTYRDLINFAFSYSEQFDELGANPGDRILVQMEKSTEALLIYLACLIKGLIYVPLNISYQDSEIKYFFDNSEPQFVVGDDCSFKRLKSLLGKNPGVVFINTRYLETKRSSTSNKCLQHRNSSDIASLIYTSGTTGLSKGAMITHGSLLTNAQNLVSIWRMRNSDRLLHVLPIFHIHGLFIALHTALLVGCEIIWLRKFSVSKILSCLNRTTIFMGVPTYYSRLIASNKLKKDHYSNVRVFISGSAPMSENLHKQFTALTKKVIVERYGMSEAGIITSNRLDGEVKVGSVGKAVGDYKLKITNQQKKSTTDGDIGEIHIKGGSLFSGYWKSPEKSEQAFSDQGWFKTGDLGFIDEYGYLTIVGRKSDLIISGGYNVYPAEIEEVIQKSKLVVDVAVIGAPDDDLGEIVVAFIVLDEEKKIDQKTLLRFLRSTIADYKVPKKIIIIKEIPKNVMGKTQKNILRKRFL